MAESIGLPKGSSLAYWGIQSVMNISHFLMVFCYLLRAYRLYFIFNLAIFKVENSKFYQNISWASQRSMIMTLILIISPIILIYLIILLIIAFYKDPGLYIKNEYGKRTDINYMIITFIEFLLELMLIFMMYAIRFVENEFQMFKEILLVTMILCITPMFSLFVYQDRLWLYGYILRNFILMLITSIVPIILSYTQKDTIEFLTSDLLTSFNLLLYHPSTLNSFENFLQNYSKGEGFIYLELYLICKLYDDLHDLTIAEKIIKKINNLTIDLPCFCPSDISNCDESSFESLYSFCAVTLEQDFFPIFQKSEEFIELKKFINKQEIVNNRISVTSFRRTGTGPGKGGRVMMPFYEN